MRSWRTTREGWIFPGFAILPPSFNPIETAYLCKQHPLPQDTLLQTESCSQWNHDQNFSPRFFFPLHRTVLPRFGGRFVRYSRGPPLLYDRCQAEVQKKGEKLGEIRQGYVAVDEKAAHVITFPVITRCREQFILLPVSFSSALLSPTSFSAFLSTTFLFLFPIAPCLFKFVSFVYFSQSFVSKILHIFVCIWLHLFFYFL